jgi:hypothetical protein
MSSRSIPSWAGYELVWGILAADEEYCAAHRFDREAERFVVVLDEAQETADRTSASEQVDVLGVEVWILCEDSLDCRFHGVTRVTSSVWVPEVSARVLRKLQLFRGRVPDRWHAYRYD